MSGKKVLGFGIPGVTSSTSGRSAIDIYNTSLNKPQGKVVYSNRGCALASDYVLGTTSTVVGCQTPTPFVRMHPHMFQIRISSCGGTPRVTVSKNAYEDMCCIVAEATSEVGWVGTVKRDGMNFSIEEIFLPGQRGHIATCEITTDGLGNLATEILQRENGVEVWNSIRFWGHVHPGNDTDPSGQDNDQMKVFRDSCTDFFVRGILGRGGRMEFTVFFYETGLVFHDVPWNIKEGDEEVTTRRAAWRKTLGSAVKPISEQATPIHNTGVSVYPDYHQRRGRMIGDRWVWEGDPGWFEENTTGWVEADGARRFTNARGVVGSSEQLSESANELMEKITASINTIKRWKLWRLCRMMDLEERGVIIQKDIRKVHDMVLETEITGGTNNTWRLVALSERRIRVENTILLALVESFAVLPLQCSDAIDRFTKDLATMNKMEDYLCGATSELSKFRDQSETRMAFLGNMRQTISAYALKLGIDLVLSTEELALPSDSVSDSNEVRRVIE